MKDIDLVKLKELAARLLNPEDRFSEVGDKFEWKAVASPAAISALIEQLEATQREREHLEIQRDGLIAALDNETLIARRAEAELNRRDAQKPVAFLVHSKAQAAYLTFQNITGSVSPEDIAEHELWQEKLYTAAPAVVLPPNLPLDPRDDAMRHSYVAGYDKCLADAKALGCQPEKVVKLPGLRMGVVQDGHAVMVPYAGGHWFNKTALLEALTAAGVKWEESGDKHQSNEQG